MSKQKIPQTDSIQELADFWDTHDLTDFDDQLEEVKKQVFERKTSLTGDAALKNCHSECSEAERGI